MCYRVQGTQIAWYSCVGAEGHTARIPSTCPVETADSRLLSFLHLQYFLVLVVAAYAAGTMHHHSRGAVWTNRNGRQPKLPVCSPAVSPGLAVSSFWQSHCSVHFPFVSSSPRKCSHGKSARHPDQLHYRVEIFAIISRRTANRGSAGCLGHRQFSSFRLTPHCAQIPRQSSLHTDFMGVAGNNVCRTNSSTNRRVGPNRAACSSSSGASRPATPPRVISTGQNASTATSSSLSISHRHRLHS